MIAMVETLPFHHRDPFDRLLAAAALVENMSILTADENIFTYDVPSVW
jgi:PIN domain nuclease of toxin-antitoxin system